ncbi:hypothetical protein NQ317_015391 [Molorchus minor]|uniref:Uncharacterized protein n=1 Tax=Molorchus minor TaxID=1323400 RepID=A0ABQ9JH30_9CUCU|nr:hypothetical protein NQ317_015391 [Molorchus minor]
MLPLLSISNLVYYPKNVNYYPTLTPPADAVVRTKNQPSTYFATARAWPLQARYLGQPFVEPEEIQKSPVNSLLGFVFLDFSNIKISNL